jgi:hypothetical protein
LVELVQSDKKDSRIQGVKEKKDRSNRNAVIKNKGSRGVRTRQWLKIPYEGRYYKAENSA